MSPIEREVTRRSFLKGAVAALAFSGLVQSARHAAGAIAASPAQDAIAERAVRAARRFSGAKLEFLSGFGVDSEPQFTAQWSELTGVDVEVVASFAKDVFQVRALSLPDFVEKGWMTPLDPFIEKYDAQGSIRDIHPINRSLTRYRGRTWGFADDGDIWPVYYRRDVFEDSGLRRAYRDTFARELRVPTTWTEFTRTAQFITEQLAPAVYGTSMGREPFGGYGSHPYFYFHFHRHGGRFFDDKTMRATINRPPGVKAVEQILAENAASVPAIERVDFIETFQLFIEGRIAMLPHWPPLGKVAEGVGHRGDVLRFLPQSRVAGKVGYTTIERSALSTGGYFQAVAAQSKHKEAAYLFAQWLTSPSISKERLKAVAFLDPTRTSHFRAAELRSAWPSGDEYMRALCDASNHGLLPLIITGAWEYAGAVDAGLRAIYGGKGVQESLNETAAAWDAITKKLGVAKQRRSYQSFLQMTGSSMETTAAAKGLAVKC